MTLEEEKHDLLCPRNQRSELSPEKKQSDKSWKENMTRQAVQHELSEDDMKNETTLGGSGSDSTFSPEKDNTGKQSLGEDKKLAESHKSEDTGKKEGRKAENQNNVDPAALTEDVGRAPDRKASTADVPIACEQSEEEEIEDCSSSTDDLQSALDEECPCENTGFLRKFCCDDANVCYGRSSKPPAKVTSEKACGRTRPNFFRSISEAGTVSSAKLPQEHTWPDNCSSEDDSDSDISFCTPELKANWRLVEKRARRQRSVRSSLPVKRPGNKSNRRTRRRRLLRSRPSLNPLVSETSSSDDSDSSSSQDGDVAANAERHSGLLFPNRFRKSRKPDIDKDPCQWNSHERDNNHGRESSCEGEGETDAGQRMTGVARISTAATAPSASKAAESASLREVGGAVSHGQEPREKSLFDTGQEAFCSVVAAPEERSTPNNQHCSAAFAKMHESQQTTEQPQTGGGNVFEQTTTDQSDHQNNAIHPSRRQDCNASAVWNDFTQNGLPQRELISTASETAAATIRPEQRLQNQASRKGRTSSSCARHETSISIQSSQDSEAAGEEGAGAKQMTETDPPAQLPEQGPVLGENPDGPLGVPQDLLEEYQETSRHPVDTIDDQPPGQDRPPPQGTEGGNATLRASGEADTTEDPDGRPRPGPQRPNSREPQIADAVHLRPFRRRGARGPDVLVQRSFGACAPQRYPRNVNLSTVDLKGWFIDMHCSLGTQRGEPVLHRQSENKSE